MENAEKRNREDRSLLVLKESKALNGIGRAEVSPYKHIPISEGVRAMEVGVRSKVRQRFWDSTERI